MTTQGTLRGLNLSTVLQMVEIDKLTCTLHVRSGENLGLLYFRSGLLLDAESGPKSGIDAAYEIVNWADGDETAIEIHEECPTDRQAIDLPVTRLLLEGLTRGDEERHEQSETSPFAPTNGLAHKPGLPMGNNGVFPLELTDLLTSSGGTTEEHLDDLDDDDKEDGVSKLQSVLDRFREEVPEFVATDIVSIDSGLSIGGTTLDPDFDSSLASASYAEVVKSNRRALDLLGLGADSTEDILVSTESVLVLIRMLGGEYFHVVAISRRGNLGFARAIMKKYEAPLLQSVGQLA